MKVSFIHYGLGHPKDSILNEMENSDL